MESESSTGPGPDQGGIRRNIRNLRNAVEGIPDKGVEAANVAVEKSRRPAALIGRWSMGVVGGIALVLAAYLLFSIYAGDGLCTGAKEWSESVACEAGTWGLLLLSAAVAALTLPGAILGIKGRKGLYALLLNTPFLVITVVGLGLLLANTGPLGALLQHNDAGWFILAVVTLAVGLPVAVKLTWRQVMYAKEQPVAAESGEGAESAEQTASP